MAALGGGRSEPVPITDIVVSPDVVTPTGIGEFDRVLGKGLVAGSTVLLGGEPGIGKSTLALQVAFAVASLRKKVLYVTGEESLKQIRLRSERLGTVSDQLFVCAETNIHAILEAIRGLSPDLVILDSIQVVLDPNIPSVAGSVNQVRQCASALIGALKSVDAVGVLIGHITKDGSLAGPKVLEHLVDVILFFEGESSQNYRLLRSFKNRYSGTHEIGIFQMVGEGLVEVANPSGLFLDELTLKNPGSIVSAVAEGTRVLLVEIQALVVETGYGTGKRTILGVDLNRGHLLIAAVEKIIGVKLSSKDIILNIVGGYKTSEPSLDLAVVAAMYSSTYDIPVSKRIGVLGEVGLTGEIRPIPHFERRIAEFEKLGFEGIIVPSRNISDSKLSKIRLYPVESLQDALKQLVTLIK